MSYDLAFWRQERRLRDSPDDLFVRLCEDEDVEGLTVLPLDRIKQRFAEEFPGIEDSGPELTWQTDEGAIQVSWTPNPTKHIQVCFHGCSGDEVDRVVRIAHEFGCPVYDPQSGDTYAPGS